MIGRDENFSIVVVFDYIPHNLNSEREREKRDVAQGDDASVAVVGTGFVERGSRRPCRVEKRKKKHDV